MRAPICTAQVACDGDNLTTASRERGYCGKCKDAMDRRKKAKDAKPLRGENTALREVQRRTILKPKGEE
jgi:hypothetical protein